MARKDNFTARESGIPLAVVDVITQEFPDVSSPDTGFDSYEIRELITDLPPNTLALDSTFMPGISRMTTSAEYIWVPDHDKTREASKHFVSFGQMLLQAEDEGEGAIYVAVKPLEDSVLAHEYGVTSHIANGGMPYAETFRPIGVMRAADGEASMVTHYRHPVRSMDNIFGNPELIDEDAVVDKALGRAGQTLATAHAGEMVVVDTQTKNLFWDILRRNSDFVFLGDFEVVESISGLTRSERQAKVADDIRIFFASARSLERQGCELPEDYNERMVMHFGRSYVARSAMLGQTRTALDLQQISSIVAEDSRLAF